MKNEFIKKSDAINRDDYDAVKLNILQLLRDKFKTEAQKHSAKQWLMANYYSFKSININKIFIILNITIYKEVKNISIIIKSIIRVINWAQYQWQYYPKA